MFILGNTRTCRHTALLTPERPVENLTLSQSSNLSNTFSSEVKGLISNALLPSPGCTPSDPAHLGQSLGSLKKKDSLQDVGASCTPVHTITLQCH